MTTPPTTGCYGARLQEQVTCRPVLPLTVPRLQCLSLTKCSITAFSAVSIPRPPGHQLTSEWDTVISWIVQLDKMVHISTTVHAVTKPLTPMCSPCDGDHQKNNGLLIWTHIFWQKCKGMDFAKFSWFFWLASVDSLGYSEHSDVIDSVVTTAEIWLIEIMILTIVLQQK